MNLRFAVASRPTAGESCSGDAVVCRESSGQWLFGVVDALGHGPLAAEVAQVATACLETVSLQRGLPPIFEALERALRGSRGAAATLCLASGSDVEACGVGNVELRSAGLRGSFASTPGILGRVRRSARVFDLTVSNGGRIFIFSDGISGRLRVSEFERLPAREAADAVLAVHGKRTDDATILVAEGHAS